MGKNKNKIPHDLGLVGLEYDILLVLLPLLKASSDHDKGISGLWLAGFSVVAA
jgi:hypothetical protein